jgi:hypothetical protein
MTKYVFVLTRRLLRRVCAKRAFSKLQLAVLKNRLAFTKPQNLRQKPVQQAQKQVLGLDIIQPQHWDNWTGPLATSIDSMANSFLSKLIDELSLPLHSMLIAYIPLNQGGLGLLDAATRAIPDFVLTMTSAYRYACDGITLGQDTPSVLLPPR